MKRATNGHRVFSRAGLAGDLYGVRDGRAPLVLLHGLSFDRRVWDPVLAELAHVDPGRRVLSVDLPGHGESADPPTWDMQAGTDSLHAALVEHCLEDPVVVGHSAGAILATAYAAQFGTSGVINVDASLDLRGFAAVLQSLEGALRGPAFDSAWRTLEAGFGTELLPPPMQALVRSYGPPRQEVALGFWNELLVKSIDDSEAAMREMLAAVNARGGTYQVIYGRRPPTEYEQWLRLLLPGVVCEVIDDSGHFPMLADPSRFAGVLASSGGWSSEAARAV